MQRFLYRLRSRHISINRLIALAFLGIILFGTLLLMLPFSSRNNRTCGLVPALFTSTSATCVTGLVLYDTWTQWSSFGQAVILFLIEVGGLGFMSIASLLIFLIRGRTDMLQRMVIAQSLGAEDMSNITRSQKRMLIGCFLVEGIGALLLTIRFSLIYDIWTAFKMGIFHSISAFCNAGFDIMGSVSPGSSAAAFQSDPFILLTLSALVILGGLGFLVWEEFLNARSFRRLSVYARLVLITTASLLLFGWILILVLEWNNPATLGALPVPTRILEAFFQSVTLRTAGFSSIDQGALTDAGKGVSMFLMMIGGSSGSTAGGLKTVTLVVILLFLINRLRGKSETVVFHRTIPLRHVFNALTIAGIMILLAYTGACMISATSPVGFTDALFEALSAIATVGLTTGATPKLSLVGKLVIILFMYFGRVGILTISLGFLSTDRPEPRYRYADANLLIG